jgi:hypothetical protein
LKILVFIITALFLLIAVVLSGLFYFKFRSSDISPDPANWGQFGDYFGMVINLAGTAVVCVLSYLVFVGQKQRDDWEKTIVELNETPILIFAADNNVYDRCLNVGKGAAHKVIVCKVSFNGSKSAIKSYSIPANGYLKIQWANDPLELYAYYESITGVKYVVKCKDDINSHFRIGKDDMPDSDKVVLEWLQKHANRHSQVSLKMISS